LLLSHIIVRNIMRLMKVLMWRSCHKGKVLSLIQLLYNNSQNSRRLSIMLKQSTNKIYWLNITRSLKCTAKIETGLSLMLLKWPRKTPQWTSQFKTTLFQSQTTLWITLRGQTQWCKRQKTQSDHPFRGLKSKTLFSLSLMRRNCKRKWNKNKRRRSWKQIKSPKLMHTW
jgi:hypothetical protein